MAGYVPTKHPEYRKREAKWRMARAAYRGGDAWGVDVARYRFSSTGLEVGSGKVNVAPDSQELNYLWPHEREKSEKYQRRLRAAVYPNFVKPIVDAIASTIVRSVRKLTLPPQLDVMLQQVDTNGNDIAAFRRLVLIEAMQLGQCYLLPEIPPGGAYPSLYHERKAGVRPFVSIVSSLDLTDWSWDDETQSFEWAQVTQRRPLKREPLSSTDGLTVPHVSILYYPGGWQEYHDGEMVAEGPGPDFVPLLPVLINRPADEPEPIGDSPIADIVEAAELVYNKKSWLTDQEASQCFNQVFIATKDPLTKEQDRILSTQTYISGGDDMKFVAPDVSPMQHLLQSMREDYQAAKATMGIETLSEQSQEAKSGIAMQMSRENLDAVLSGYSRPFEAAERTMWRTCALLAKADPEDVVVEWSHDFSALAAAGRFDQIIMALTQGDFGGKAKAELQKQLFMAACPELDEDVQRAIMEDIDASVDESLVTEQPEPVTTAETTTPRDDESAPAETGLEAVAEPAMSADEKATDLAVSGEVKDPMNALNGAQVTALLEVIQRVADGMLPRATGVSVIVAAFPITLDDAEKIMGDVGTEKFEAAKPEPAPSPFGGEQAPKDDNGP